MKETYVNLSREIKEIVVVREEKVSTLLRLEHVERKVRKTLFTRKERLVKEEKYLVMYGDYDDYCLKSWVGKEEIDRLKNGEDNIVKTSSGPFKVDIRANTIKFIPAIKIVYSNGGRNSDNERWVIFNSEEDLCKILGKIRDSGFFIRQDDGGKLL